MKRARFVVLLLLLSLVLLAGCTLTGVSGSGDIVTREEDFSDFDEIRASYSFDVEINQGEDYRVVIRIDDNLEQYLDVGVSGGRLRLGMESGRNYSNATLEATVTMPELTEVDLSGASDARVAGFQSRRPFNAGLSGSSTLRGEIESGDIRLDLSGSSDVNLTGSGDNLDVDASGSSEIDLADYPVENADLNLSGSSDVTVNVSGRLDVNASGASNVYYVGNPSLGTIDTSGSSSVEER